MFRVDVDGDRALVVRLLALASRLDDLRRPLSRVASRGASLARMMTPRRTGALAASIRPSATGDVARVIAGRGRTGLYAGVQNYGWPAHGISATHYLQRVDPVWTPLAEREIDSHISSEINHLELS